MNTTIDNTEGLFQSATHKQKHYSPLANIYQHADEYILTLAAPGFHRNQFVILVEKDILSISPVNKEKTRNRKDYLHEYDYSHWHRRFILPANADATMIASTYINGELIIHIPKQHKQVVHDDIKSVVVY